MRRLPSSLALVPLLVALLTAAALAPGAQAQGTQEVRLRLVQDDQTVGGMLKVAVEVRTLGLDANTLGSATIDIGFDTGLLTLSGVQNGVLAGREGYSVTPDIIGGGSVIRLTVTSSGIGPTFLDNDGYEVGDAFVTLYTYTFTIGSTFDRTGFPFDCATLSVGYHDDLDDANGNDVIVDNTSGAVPMAAVLPLALRTLELSAGEGWRVLSGLPRMTVDDLLGPLTTVGFPGASVETGFPNVWRWDEDAGWLPPASQSEVLDATAGVAFNALAADLPASLRMAGAHFDQAYTRPPGDGTFASCSAFPLPFDVAYDAGGASGHEPGWNLVGNPTGETLDWDAAGWTKDGLDNVVYVYDPTSAQYLTWNGTAGTLGDGLVRELQGFWVKATAADPQLIAPTAALSTGGVFYGRQGVLAEETRGEETPDAEAADRHGLLALRLDGEVGGAARWAGAFVSFQPGGQTGLDRYDAEALAPLGEARLDLYTLVTDGEDAVPLEIDARGPADLRSVVGVPVEIPLAVAVSVSGAPVGGSFVLSWAPPEGLPEGLSVVLVDRETGAEVDLRTASSYAFTLDAPAAQATRDVTGQATRAGARAEARASTARDAQPQRRTQPERTFALAPPYAARAALDEARFALRLTPTHGGEVAGTAGLDGAASPAAASALPEAFALEGAAPNPSAGVTAVRYALPEAGAVALAVYDLLGRRVAVLAEGDREAGYHTARWDASRVAAGTYVVRLIAGGGAFTRTLTVVR